MDEFLDKTYVDTSAEFRDKAGGRSLRIPISKAPYVFTVDEVALSICLFLKGADSLAAFYERQPEGDRIEPWRAGEMRFHWNGVKKRLIKAIGRFSLSGRSRPPIDFVVDRICPEAEIGLKVWRVDQNPLRPNNVAAEPIFKFRCNDPRHHGAHSFINGAAGVSQLSTFYSSYVSSIVAGKR